MNLQKKSIAIIGATLVALMAALYGLLSFVLSRDFESLERQNVSLSVERSLDSLNAQILDLDTQATQWANGDETLSSLNANSAGTVRVNFVAVINPAGEIAFAKAFDLQTGTETEVPESLLIHLKPGDELVELARGGQHSVTGLLQLPTGLAIVSARATTLGGAVTGTLIAGRYLDSRMLKAIAETTHLSVTLQRLSPGEQLPVEFDNAQRALISGKSTFIEPRDERIIAGYSMVRDVYRAPAAILRVELPRTIFEKGRDSLRYLLSSVLIAGLVFTGTSMGLLRKYVLAPLSSLNHEITRIGESSDPSARLYLSGTGEVFHLANAINGMLEALEISRRSLREGEERHRAVVEQLAEGILIVDPVSMRVVEANAATRSLLGYDAAELHPVRLLDMVAGENREEMNDHIEHLLFDGGSFACECEFVKKDASRAAMQVGVTLVVHGGRRVLCAIIHDITEKKRAQETLQRAHEELEKRVVERTAELSASLHEKEVLLKEIHHRVKNNLQVISSLLNIQSTYIKDPASLSMFLESRNRVRSMALVHERLYQSPDLARIDFAGYIRALVANLSHSFAGGSQRVNLIVDVRGVMLGVDTAVPCGLIVNELVSNCYKYAFPENRAGEVRISLMPADASRVELTVADNGVGFPKHVDFRNTDSLGMQLVNTLTQQLHGKIEMKNGTGTQFKINFKAGS